MPEVLILEDDCVPAPHFKKNWKVVKEWLDNNPELWDIYSGAATNIVMPSFVSEHKGVKFYNPMWSVAAHFIVIPQRMYSNLIKYYERVSIGAKLISILAPDVHNNLFKTVISYPFLAYQEYGYSNVSRKTRNRRKNFKNAEMLLHKA
jgi:hypothetical protein